MAKKRDYFGMGWFISVILAIIPTTSLILGFVTRLQEGKYVAAILRIVLGWNLIWLLDLLCILFTGSICRILNV